MQKKSKILIIEDDDTLREALSETLGVSEYPYISLSNAQEAVQVIAQETIGLVITDVQLPEMSGIQLLDWLSQHHAHIPVIIMTAYSSIKDAVTAIQKGASDYLAKPFPYQELLNKVENYYIDFSIEPFKNQPIAEDAASLHVLALAKKVASSDASVLITGESGTGKEVLARYIHQHSNRSTQPFIAINCAAIPEQLLEATLFGHEKGAFSGAHQSYPGKFEQANGGILLLDEIGEMPMLLQAKLLRVLQEKEVERIGGKKTIPLDVRILATTNRDIKQEVIQGSFREDLYYRLNVFPLQWLPLRDRKHDILPMAENVLQKMSKKKSLRAYYFDDSAKEKLYGYLWPGNVRELENVIQRALILAKNTWITAEDLLLESSLRQAPVNSGVSLEQLKHSVQDNDSVAQIKTGRLDTHKQEHEFQMIIETLKTTQGSRRVAAQKLGISPRTLRYKMAKMRDAGIHI